MSFHLGIEKIIIIITMSTQNDVVFYKQKKNVVIVVSFFGFWTSRRLLDLLPQHISLIVPH